jgi:DNA primase
LSRIYVDWWEQYRLWSTFPTVEDSKDAEPWATYMFNRGFLPDVLDEYQVGYDLMTDRVVLPVRDEHSNLIGFKGREYNRKTKVKYLVFGDREGREARFGYKPYEASYVLYLFDTASPRDDLFIVEGELNALMMRQHGYPGAVGINSNQLSEHQLNLLRRYCRSVILIFDADNEASRMALATTVELLEPYLRVYITPHHPRDPAEMSREDVDQLVSQAKSSTVVRLTEHFQRS